MWGYLKYAFWATWFYLRRKNIAIGDWILLRRLTQNRIKKRAYKLPPPSTQYGISYSAKWKLFLTQEVSGMGGWILWHDLAHGKMEYAYWVPSETASEFKSLLQTMKDVTEVSSKIGGVVVDPDIMAMLSNGAS